MNEKLLQFIWQSQHFNRSELSTTTGERITIVSPGQWNHDQGPDFLNAKIVVGQTIWAGNIELHCKTSDWHKHGHAYDSAYSKIILHVVYEHDISEGIVDFPTLELNNRIPYHLLHRYEQLMLQAQWIPCAMHLTNISELTKTTWLQRIYAERLSYKIQQIESLLFKYQFHWDRILWILLARAFGMSKNCDAFQMMAEQIDYTQLRRLNDDPIILESLFMGTLNMVPTNSSDIYSSMLNIGFKDLLHKRFTLLLQHPVLYAKMRPDNFPTIRLSQLASLWCKKPFTLDMILEIESMDDLKKHLRVETSSYWKEHYVFGRRTAMITKTTGDDFIEALAINFLIPVLFLYAKHTKQISIQDRMIQWMEMLKPEKNSTVRQFECLGINAINAMESQALLHLKKKYCDPKRCLECAFGRVMLNKVVI